MRYASFGRMIGFAGFLAVVGLGALALRGNADEPRRVNADAGADAVERTRDQVKMLDDLYKNAVVSITAIYDGPPAIKVAKQVFGAMEKKGWHKARLVDVTGAPLNEANEPKTEFEKRAAEAIKAGKPYYDEVAGEGAERRLLAATIVPAVMKKCATCHGAKEGDLLGFISYDVPVK